VRRCGYCTKLRHLLKYLTNARIAAGTSFAGLIEVPRGTSAGRAIEDIVILPECLGDDGWENRVHFVPL
jgi:hypothetical protein